MKIGVLTSSRADYGIYLPLLKRISEDKSLDLNLIVFGTHLSKFHGFTIEQIKKDGFEIKYQVDSFLISDTSNGISSSYALTALKFSDFWNLNKSEFDIVFALGDRFEMAAAVAASIPYQINIAHLHGGETTLGAIDNIYRHSITLASQIHFVSTEFFISRVSEILGNSSERIFNVGSLSLENLNSIKLLSLAEFKEEWGIDLTIPSVLVTVHPETVDYELNDIYCRELTKALSELFHDFQIIITMPNADTAGILYRNSFLNLSKQSSKVKVVENFGTKSYFTCMKHAYLLLGNTSSGIIEAATFNKFVINLGDRQKGRLTSENIINVPFISSEIVGKTKEFITRKFEGKNIYEQPNPSQKIVNVLKKNSCKIIIDT